MDDLYANAWSDPPDHPLSDLKPSASSGSSWVSPQLSNISDEEADLAAPSWSTGAGIRWNEPAENAGFSWTQAEPDLAWGTSTYENIPIGNPAQEPRKPSPTIPELEVETAIPTVSESARAPSPKDRSVSPSPAQTEIPSPEIHPPVPTTPSADLDGFGTFETAIVSDEGTAMALEEAEDNADTWGAAWTSAPEESAQPKADPVDEWELAKEQKAHRDRRVPPELLATILKECDQFTSEVWPDPPPEEPENKEEEWKKDWRQGMDGVEGLNSLLQDFLPPLTLQPPVQFSTTTVAKNMATSLRLTKHLAITKGSPMFHYLAAKGSTAWEVAVKEQKEIVEDVVPVGWRILEKEQSSEPAVDSSKGKKTTSRLFSFWGRRESSISESQSSSRNEVEGVTTSAGAESSDSVAHSRHGSQDSSRASVRNSVDTVVSPVQTNMSSTSSLPSAVEATATTSSSSISASHASSYANAPELQPDTTEAPQPAPSAVSRFLNRFSRRRSTMGSGGSPHSSLALSSDDLQFLSDLVPSAEDDAEDEIDVSFKGFSTVLRPESILPVLPPPPPPPPRSAALGSEPASAVSQAEPSMSSFDSFFDSHSDSASGSQPSASTTVSPPTSSTLHATTAPMILQPSKPPRPSTPNVPSIPLLPKVTNRPSSPSPLGVRSAKQPSHPFYLPSPPSSRSQTPASVVPDPSSSHTLASINASSEAKTEMKPPKAPARSKAPAPPFPPPRPASAASRHSRPDSPSRPDTPTSSLPLAQLYPNAIRSGSFANVPPRSMSPFTLPPPPSSRPQSTGPLPPLLAPPPPPRSQSTAPLPLPLAPPLTSSAQSATPPKPPPQSALDDDDEFTEFLSSSTVPVQSKPILSSRPSLSRRVTPSRNGRRSSSVASIGAPAIASPSSSKQTKSSTHSTGPAANIFDDDDLSDFHFSPATTQPQSTMSFDSPLSSGFLSSTSTTLLPSQPSPGFASPAVDESFSEHSFLTPVKTSGFDLSGNSPILRTPSPPRPISKNSLPFAPPPSAPAQQGSASTNLRLNKAASHLHTLNLMERAAARPGRWPAPPSPLPKGIPGPGSARATNVDLLSDDSFTTQPQGGTMSVSLSSPAVMSPQRQMSSSGSGLGIGNVPTLPPPMSNSQSLQAALFDAPLGVDSLFGLSKPVAPPLLPAKTAPPSAQSSAKTGGLSAQDLMFFEGL